jgi:hypothetical protein
MYTFIFLQLVIVKSIKCEFAATRSRYCEANLRQLCSFHVSQSSEHSNLLQLYRCNRPEAVFCFLALQHEVEIKMLQNTHWAILN